MKKLLFSLLFIWFCTLNVFCAPNPIYNGPGTTNTPAAWTNIINSLATKVVSDTAIKKLNGIGTNTVIYTSDNAPTFQTVITTPDGSVSLKIDNNTTPGFTIAGDVWADYFHGNAQYLFGSGLGLTNYSGTNLIAGSVSNASIAEGTISTNKMDTNAYAAFIGGGSGTTYTNNATGLPGVIVGSGIGTNLASLAPITNTSFAGLTTVSNLTGKTTSGALSNAAGSRVAFMSDVGVTGNQTNTYWDLTGTKRALEADASGPVLYVYSHLGAANWRMDDTTSYIHGTQAVVISVTGSNYNDGITAFYADRTGATTVGVPSGVVTIQGTVNFNSAPAFTVTDNGVSTVVRSNMVESLVGSFTTTTNAGNAIIKANGVQSLISSNQIFTGTLTADTNNITYGFWANLYSTSQSNALAWFQSNGLIVGTNIVAGGVGFSGSVTNGGGTASTFVVHDANKKLIGTAASSVLATTLTDETGTGVVVFGTAPTFTTGLLTPQTDYTTNSGSAVSPNMLVSYALLSTNAAFSMLLPTGVDTGQTKVQTSVLLVTNTTAAVVVITAAAAPVKSTGTLNVTNVTVITTTVYPKVVTNMVYLPLF